MQWFPRLQFFHLHYLYKKEKNLDLAIGLMKLLDSRKSLVTLDIFLLCEWLLSKTITLYNALVLSLELEHSFNTKIFSMRQVQYVPPTVIFLLECKSLFLKEPFLLHSLGHMKLLREAINYTRKTKDNLLSRHTCATHPWLLSLFLSFPFL